MSAHNEFLVMNGHTSPGFGDSTLEMSVTQSFYSDGTSMYSDERSPLLMCTPTRNHVKKSSVLYVNKGALQRAEPKPKGTR